MPRQPDRSRAKATVRPAGPVGPSSPRCATLAERPVDPVAAREPGRTRGPAAAGRTTTRTTQSRLPRGSDGKAGSLQGQAMEGATGDLPTNAERLVEVGDGSLDDVVGEGRERGHRPRQLLHANHRRRCGGPAPGARHRHVEPVRHQLRHDRRHRGGAHLPRPSALGGARLGLPTRRGTNRPASHRRHRPCRGDP